MKPYFKTIALLLLLFSLAAADNTAIMKKLLAAIKPAPNNWSAESSPCLWNGVKCDIPGRIVAIDLAYQSLSGTLPSDLNYLSHLSSLFLNGNSFSGAIPTLAYLALLEEIHLDGNNFTSVPPKCFQGLTSLQILTMSHNLNLLPWSFPSELSESPSLVTLHAVSCNIMGSIPDIFDSFAYLQDLTLSYNNRTGCLLSSLGRSGVANLWLNNQLLGLSGTIAVLANMTQLYEVWLHANQLTGPIPDLWFGCAVRSTVER